MLCHKINYRYLWLVHILYGISQKHKKYTRCSMHLVFSWHNLQHSKKFLAYLKGPVYAKGIPSICQNTKCFQGIWITDELGQGISQSFKLLSPQYRVGRRGSWFWNCLGGVTLQFPKIFEVSFANDFFMARKTRIESTYLGIPLGYIFS